MGLTRTPPQVVYPRSTFITPTPQGGPSTQPHQTPSLSTPRASLQPHIQQGTEDPVTPVKADRKLESSSRPSTNGLQHFPTSSQSSGGAGFTPLSARVTPIAAARPIITPSENGPLNAHINSLNKQLVELEALKKDLNARLADSEKKLDSEIARRDRTIRDLTIQYEKEKQEWKDTLSAVQIVHNIAHQRARHELEQERLNYFNSESRILQQNVRILVRDHSLTRFQVHEAQVGKESASYQDQLMDTKEQIEELQRTLEQATESYEKELAGQKESIKVLRKQLEHERKSRGSIEVRENVNSALTLDLENVRKELTAAQSRIKDLQSGATEAKSTQKSLEKAKSKHEAELEKLNDEIDSLNKENKVAQERIDELTKQSRALEKERDKRVKAEVDQKTMQKQVSELEEGRSKEIKKVETELKKAIKELENKLSRSQAEAREAQETAQAAETRASALERRLASAKEPKSAQSASAAAKAKAKEKPSEDPEEAHSKSSDRAVEELVFTDPSEDEEDIEVFVPPQSRAKAQPKSKPSSSNPPASTSERSKPRPKARPPPPKSPSPPPKSKATDPEVFEIDDDEVIPVKTKARPKPRPPPELSPPPISKPASKPKTSGKGKQTVIIDDDDESEIPSTKAKPRAPAKEKEKPKGKVKETGGASNSKRPIDDELDAAEETGEKKKKKRKLFGAENADFNWGAGPGLLDTLGIPTALSPIRDKGDKIPRHRRV
ncbi:unnamed protein product [Rhizoctonia solani]|uniref:Uncharacterized protein n=1 Tax=Rhizoctonia solani TaxID=456999 RepID=A0A8H2X719_9AGAM|nr:unnamed protein product [Rhizoctonia solani]